MTLGEDMLCGRIVKTKGEERREERKTKRGGARLEAEVGDCFALHLEGVLTQVRRGRSGSTKVSPCLPPFSLAK
jgi:hypothetical protein